MFVQQEHCTTRIAGPYDTRVSAALRPKFREYRASFLAVSGVMSGVGQRVDWKDVH